MVADVETGEYLVEPAPITVSAGSASRLYGEANSFADVSDPTAEGLRLGDAVGDAITIDAIAYATNADISSDVLPDGAAYDLTFADGADGLNAVRVANAAGAFNYVVADVETGEYLVEPAPLRLVVVDQRLEGQANDFANALILVSDERPLRAGDTLEDLGDDFLDLVRANLQTDATFSSTPGSYEISLNPESSLNLTNYVLESVDASVLVDGMRIVTELMVNEVSPAEITPEPDAPDETDRPLVIVEPEGPVALSVSSERTPEFGIDDDLLFESILSNGGNETIW